MDNLFRKMKTQNSNQMYFAYVTEHVVEVLGKYILTWRPVYFVAENLRGVVGNTLECDIIVNQPVLHTRFYVHTGTNALGKHMKPVIPLAMS